MLFRSDPGPYKKPRPEFNGGTDDPEVAPGVEADPGPYKKPRPEFNNGTDEIEPYTISGTYDYLQTFYSYKVDRWEVAGSEFTLFAQPLPDNVEEVYFEIVYADSKQLYYIEKPNFSTEVTIEAAPQEKVVDVKLFVKYRSSENYGSYEYPYNFMDDFVTLPVSRWIYSGNLKVSASGWTPALEDVFMELEYSNGSNLVYIGKPTSGDFSVNNIYGKNLTSVYLFGSTSFDIE